MLSVLKFGLQYARSSFWLLSRRIGDRAIIAYNLSNIRLCVIPYKSIVQQNSISTDKHPNLFSMSQFKRDSSNWQSN